MTTQYEDDATMRDALREPFPPELIGSLPKAGTTLSYVGHAAVTDRLNRVAPGWSYSIDRIVEREVNGMPHVLAVIGSVTIGGLTRQEVGDVERPTHYGDELKKAISDLIRRGAMRFGVALDLWSKEDLLSSSGASPSTSTPDEAPAAEVAAGTARTRKRPAAAPGTTGAGSVPPSAAAPVPGDREFFPPTLPTPGDEATPSMHFPAWQPSPKARGFEVCAFPGCVIHPARRVGGAA